MGVRLYPCTMAKDEGRRVACQLQQPALLEALAGVPAGTWRRVRLWEKADEAMSELDHELGTELSYKLFSLRVDNDPEADRLHSFILFGWGRVRAGASLCPDYVGYTFDRREMRLILEAQGVALEETLFERLEGLIWG